MQLATTIKVIFSFNVRIKALVSRIIEIRRKVSQQTFKDGDHMPDIWRALLLDADFQEMVESLVVRQRPRIWIKPPVKIGVENFSIKSALRLPKPESLFSA